MSSTIALSQFLYRNKAEFKARYRWSNSRTPQRMLTESECIRIRQMTIRSDEQILKVFAQRGRRRAGGVLGSIIDRATT